MGPTGTSRSRRILQHILAGIETGVLGSLLAAGWYGFSSLLQGQPVWVVPGRIGTALFESLSLRNGFSQAAAAGIAFQVVAGGVLGATFGLLVGDTARVARTMLLGILFSLCCFYAWYSWLGPSLMPAEPLPASARSVLVAHLLFGAHLGRYPHALRLVRGAE